MARAYNQAQKFGVEMAIPDEAVRLHQEDTDQPIMIDLANQERVLARTVVIATGARYRRLAVANLAAFEGSSVHYWASPLEAHLCNGEEVALVGGGNSAGQAAVYLATRAAKVWMVARGSSLNRTMSSYLIERIAAQPNIEVLLETQVFAVEGEGGTLQAVKWRDRSGAETRKPIRHLFLFIGADPNSDWLSGSGLELDSKGFVRTDALGTTGQRSFESNLPGVFAIGDVRAGSTKRLAAAVGEGAQVISTIHGYLARRELGAPHQ